MKVAIIQYSPIWEEPHSNFKNLEIIFSKLQPETEMVILPEMFNTGFSMKTRIAESQNGATLNWMKFQSKKFTIVGSLAFEENNQFFNRLFVWRNGNLLGTYDKRKLFGMAKEDRIFTAGKSNLNLNINGYKFSFFTCYDLRFPEVLRNIHEYDVAVIVASWPEKRIEHWNTLLKARAIENQSYVLACNRIGIDGNDMVYDGSSQIIEPDGRIIAQNVKQETILYVNLKKSLIDKTRNKLPFLKDQ